MNKIQPEMSARTILYIVSLERRKKVKGI